MCDCRSVSGAEGRSVSGAGGRSVSGSGGPGRLSGPGLEAQRAGTGGSAGRDWRQYVTLKGVRVTNFGDEILLKGGSIVTS